MNGQHFSLLPPDELLRRVTPAFVAAGYGSADDIASRREWVLGLLEHLKIRARTVDEIVWQAAPFFNDNLEVAKQWKDREGTLRVVRGAREVLAALVQWDVAAMEPPMHSLAASLGYGDKLGKLFQPLRVALTGRAVSPGIYDVLAMLGRERSLARLEAAEALLSAPV